MGPGHRAGQQCTPHETGEGEGIPSHYVSHLYPSVIHTLETLTTNIQTLDEMTSRMEALSEADTHLYGSLYTINALDGQTRQHIEEVG